MSWNFSPVLVAAFLEECSLDTDQSVLSNTTPTPDQYYWPDKPTEHSRLSRFGTTCAPFEGSRGAELLTWYLAGFPAKTSALPEPEPESTEREADSGARWPGSLAKYDPDTCSWKTAQRSLLGDSEPSLVTWPRSGLMLGGQCWELPTLERRTDASESGYWPTPNTVGYRSDGELLMLSRKLDNHQEYLAMTDRACRSKRERYWPTPTVCGNYNRKGASATSGDGLATAVANRMIPTPVASMGKSSSPKSLQRKDGRDRTFDILDHMVMAQNHGHLSPDWTEWLMGWPIGHTALKPLAMGRFHEFVQQHGECLTYGEAANV